MGYGEAEAEVVAPRVGAVAVVVEVVEVAVDVADAVVAEVAADAVVVVEADAVVAVDAADAGGHEGGAKVVVEPHRHPGISCQGQR